MKKLGRYLILEEVGRGAMGRIYRARDPEIDRVVAIKTISVTGFDVGPESEFHQRFLREAKAAGKLLHPGIVTIFDVGEDPETGTPYIVMEYIQGRSLQDAGSDQQLPREQAIELVKQLADALDYAHREGIVHRDIKPANVIVTADGRAKIADFGVAKLQAIEMTQSGMMMGTPTYMSPEQMLGEGVDGRSDLFSLVTVLYWLVTGKRPFVGNTIAALSFNIVHSQAPPPSSVEPTLSEEFDQLVQKGLAKEADDRYQTGRELADDLDDLLNGRHLRSLATRPRLAAKESASATSTPTWGRPAVLGLIAVIALLVVVAGVSWQSLQPEVPPGPPPSGEETPLAVTPAPAPPERPPPSQRRVQATPSPQPPPANSRAPAASTAIVRLQGVHPFTEATMSFYGDGKLLKRIALKGSGGSTHFTEQVPVRAGDRVLSVSVREEGETRTERAYLEGQFAQGQTRTLEVAFDRRGRMSLRWAD